MSFSYLKTFDESQTFNAAFAVKINDSYLNDPVAIRLVINEKEKKVYWENTAKGEEFEYLEWVAHSDFISFKLNQDQTCQLIYLTKKVFTEIKDRVAPLQNEFLSDQDLQNYYLNTCFF